MIAVGNRHTAKGMVWELFELAQEYWFPERKPIPIEKFKDRGLNEALYAPGGLAEKRGEEIYVRGAEKSFAWLFQKSAAGKQPKKKRKKKRTESPDERPLSDDNGSKRIESSLLSSLSSSLSSLSSELPSQPLYSLSISSDGVDERPPPAGEVTQLRAVKDKESNRAVWNAYRMAYLRRYQVEPVRNAKANANVADFVKRVGAEDAPAIIGFYVTHNDGFYVRSMHSFGHALRDAEALRTQWLKGKAITQNDVRKFERNQDFNDTLTAVRRGEV